MTSLNDAVEEGELEEGEIGDEPCKETERQHKSDGGNINVLNNILIENGSKDSSCSRKGTDLILLKNKKQKHTIPIIKKENYREKHVCHLKDKRQATAKVKHSSSEKKSTINKSLQLIRTPKCRYQRPINAPYASTRPKWSGHKARNANTSGDISYEDLLNQYKQIQSKVENFGRRRKSETKLESKYRNERNKKSSKGEKVTSEKENHQKQHLNCSKSRRTRKSSVKEISKEHPRLKKNIDKPKHTSYAQVKKHKVTEKLALVIKNKEKFTVKKEEEEDEYVLRMKALASRSIGLTKFKQTSFDKREILEIKDVPNECKDDLLEGRSKEKIIDNYDLVDMDIDSDIETNESCIPCAIPNSVDNGNSQEEEDIDEETLRQQLLVALDKRKKQQMSINLVNNNENVKGSSFVHQFDGEMIQLNDQNFQDCLPIDYNGNIPLCANNHQSLVINLEDDSSDCSEFEDNHSAPEINVQAGLEQLLKEARMESDRKIASTTNSPDTSDTNDTGINFGNTPAAVYRLSRAQQLEYRKLKELIAKKESNRTDQLTKSHLLKQSCQRLPQFEAKLNICNATLRKENHLMKLLRMHINKKKLVLRNAQMNVQKLKQQLSGAEKVVGQNLQVIHKLNMQLKTVQSSAERRSSLVTELEKECTKLGVQLFGTSYKLPLPSLLPLS